jgi:hypothetical protein
VLFRSSEKEKQDYKNLAQSFLNIPGDNPAQKRTYIAKDGSFMRFYFAMHTSIIEYEGQNFTADENGLVTKGSIKDFGKIKLIGRKKSDTVRGTGSNIIEEDRILLKTPLTVNGTSEIFKGYTHKNSNILFFNMGERQKH